MEKFIYHNIFQTKGIEYIIIIAFLILLVPFWWFVNRKSRVVQAIKKSLGILKPENLKAPEGIFYNKNHTWAHLQKSGVAEVGLDDWLIHIIGNIDFGFLKNEGEEIKKGETLFEIQNNGKSLKIPSPISGKIINANSHIGHEPQTLMNDPYNKGWIYEIEPANWKAETSSFMVGEEVRNWFKNELLRFKDFVAHSVSKNSPQVSMVVLQEGGELRDNPLNDLPGEVWKDFQKEFLDL